MKRFVFPFTAILMILLVRFCADAQEPSPTFDPFASGSFYIEITPEPESDPSENRLGKDKAEMVLIPAGTFMMGSDDADALIDTKPAHEVYLNEFWIDKYEVTNAQFARCVESGYCYEPRDLSSAARENYYSDMMESQEEIRALWHDITKYMNSMEALVSNDKLDEANSILNDLRSTVASIHLVVDTGNEIIDSILSYEMKSANGNNKTK